MADPDLANPVIPDQALIARARAGDSEAFTDLAAPRLRQLNAVARLILRDLDLAEDAVQEALVDAWRDLRGLREPGRFDAWLHRLLVHACYSQSRARRRWHLREAKASAEAPMMGTDPGIGVAMSDELERGLARLSVEQRAIVVLVYYLDKPVPEAAAILGIPIGTAKSRLHRSLDALRAALDAADRLPRAAHERPA